MARKMGSAAPAAARSQNNNTNSIISYTNSCSSKNPVEQLNLLRSFVAGSSDILQQQQEGYSETDLVDCLKQSGYNVQRAAELLITGQFQKRAANGTGHKQKNAKSAFFSVVTNSPLKEGKKKGMIRKNAQRQPRIHTSISNIKPAAASALNKSTRTPNRTPTVAVAVSDLSLNNDDDANAMVSSESEKSTTATIRLLLCRRWLSDAVITCRKGRVKFQETLHLEHSLSGYGMVRFRTENADGRLPENLAALLAPLLRHGACSSGRLIEVQAESMMEDNTLVMGSSLPVQVTVYLTSPKAFFETMLPQDPSVVAEPSKASQYFASKAMSNSNNSSKQQRHSKNLSTADAAFLLLQWAEYGDVPDFKVVAPQQSLPPTEGPSCCEAGAATTTLEDANKKPAAKEDFATDDSDADLVELDEEEFEEAASDDDGSTAQGKVLMAGCVVEGAAAAADNKWSTMLPEAEDPAGFSGTSATTTTTTLRPYQKQALYFMMQRETAGGESREQLEDQLQLLQELSAEQQQQQKGSPKAFFPGDSNNNNNKKEIICECGPVLVSDAAQKKSATLDGEINPVKHPLWKRRFLATPGMSSSIAFYVNELLGVATYEPPEPPRPCSGGILADAMGLGKTVMLMALILKSKEERLAAASLASSDKDSDALDSGPSATLVVAKLSLLPQWEDELKSKTNLSYKIYYGQNGKPPSVKDLQAVVSEPSY